MFELFAAVVFIWLLVKVIGLAFRLTWGAAKFAAGILLILGFPVLFFCFLFIGGFALMIPLIMIAALAEILQACR